MKNCKKSLKAWARNQKEHEEILIKEKLSMLHHLQLADSLDNEEDEPAMQEELHVLLELEDLKWRQKAKTNWLQNGDRNTRYFHAYASQRK